MCQYRVVLVLGGSRYQGVLVLGVLMWVGSRYWGSQYWAFLVLGVPSTGGVPVLGLPGAATAPVQDQPRFSPVLPQKRLSRGWGGRPAHPPELRGVREHTGARGGGGPCRGTGEGFPPSGGSRHARAGQLRPGAPPAGPAPPPLIGRRPPLPRPAALGARPPAPPAPAASHWPPAAPRPLLLARRRGRVNPRGAAASEPGAPRHWDGTGWHREAPGGTGRHRVAPG